MNAPHTKEETCWECGAVLPPKAGDCWLCGSPCYPVAELVVPEVAPSEHRTALQFSLSTLMLAVTLLSVLLGVFLMAPGLGVCLTVLVIPPFLRTLIVATRRKARGQPMSTEAKLGTFAKTFGITIAIAICVIPTVIVVAFVAFFVICMAAMQH